jgi:hypothetical protein
MQSEKKKKKTGKFAGMLKFISKGQCIDTWLVGLFLLLPLGA